MIHSPLMDQEYEHKVINFRQNVIDRVKTIGVNELR